VGEGAKTEENPCESIMLVAPLAVVSFSVMLVRRRAPSRRD
jgi:hypothetical protein